MLAVVKIVALFALISTFENYAQAAQKKWWEVASFYQIYPRSFKDSDGNGIGDLKGVTEKLPYLKEIGITATWLSPIFTSPMADFGYDIANFTEIAPIFGTMEDFEALIAKANDLGIKIILDFVPNHSSDECEWFMKSAAGDKDYKDFYVWHPGKLVNGTRHPPTNWISVFRGSQWTWHEGRKEYYLHQFLAKQPDLNYRNPVVLETMKNVLRFWLKKGVAGFRVDAVPHAFEVAPDKNGDYPDEPRNTAVNDTEDYTYLQHIYTTNQPETIELVYDFRAVLDEMQAELGGDERILMTEAYAPLDVVMQYYGDEKREGAQMPFNFELISNLNNKSNAHHYVELIHRWLDSMPAGRTANWVLGNHDQSRIGSRLGSDRIDMINLLLFTLPGCSVTYNGEEIGMTDVWISWEDTVDPQACQSNPQEFERLTRDPVRTPFQWNDEKNAGFSDGKSTWLPVSSNYKTVNVKNERGIPTSHLNIFKQLQSLRTERSMREGNVEVKALSDDILAIKRSLSGEKTFIVLLNLMNQPDVIDLNNFFSDISGSVEYVLVTDKSIRRRGDRVNAHSVFLFPKEAVVLRTI